MRAVVANDRLSRKHFFMLEKTCSIGLNCGEYGGTKITVFPASSIAFKTSLLFCVCTSMDNVMIVNDAVDRNATNHRMTISRCQSLLRNKALTFWRVAIKRLHPRLCRSSSRGEGI